MSKKLIFGTSGKVDAKTLEKCFSKKIIFHTSYDYDGYEYLKNFLLNKKTTKIIFKVKYDDLSSLKKLITKYKKDFNLKKIYAIQISRKPDFFNEKQVYQFLKELKKNNFLEKIYIEIYWDYSEFLNKKINDKIIDGYVFCYNIIEREVKNNLLKKIRLSKKEIIGLRTFSGYNLKKNNKTFYHISYLKYYTIKIIILFLKMFTKLNYFELSLLFVKTDNLNFSIFTTKKLKKLEHIISSFDKFTYKKNLNQFSKLINFFHNFLWFAGGTNSSSSKTRNISLYYKIEQKLVFICRKFLM